MVVKIKNSFFFSLCEAHLGHYAVPANITSAWACGFCLGVLLSIQILSGSILASFFESSALTAFNSVQDVMRNANRGWLLKIIHANGASLIFLLVYFHLFRGLYYSVYFKNYCTWITGIIIFLLLMATAFFGYTLPWGQMSYWGSVVIINFTTAIPFVGVQLRDWIWGGESVTEKTIIRFMMLHYFCPLVLIFVVYVHLYFLHISKDGSTTPEGTTESFEVVTFFPKFVFKDLIVFIFVFVILGIFVLKYPDFFLDAINYFKADPFKTPNVIKPEWYFLPFYAILRSITESKLVGVLVMLLSIVLFLFVPKLSNFDAANDLSYRRWHTDGFWLFFLNFCGLGILGMLPATQAVQAVGFYLTGFHFFIFFIVFIALPFLVRHMGNSAATPSSGTGTSISGSTTTESSNYPSFNVSTRSIGSIFKHFYFNKNDLSKKYSEYWSSSQPSALVSTDFLDQFDQKLSNVGGCDTRSVFSYLEDQPADWHEVTFPAPVLRVERAISWFFDQNTPEDFCQKIAKEKQITWPLCDGEAQLSDIRNWKW